MFYLRPTLSLYKFWVLLACLTLSVVFGCSDQLGKCIIMVYHSAHARISKNYDLSRNIVKKRMRSFMYYNLISTRFDAKEILICARSCYMFKSSLV